jgi:hypothetical protein
MASVDEMINTLVESENYTSASFEEKTSMVYELLVNLAEHGTEEYPYSLIFPDSISFTGTMYEFKYSCGVSGGVSMPIFMLGDCNGDGNFDISDVVLFQKWLLNVPNTELANWKAADLCEDEILNAFDLCLLKRSLLEMCVDDEAVEMDGLDKINIIGEAADFKVRMII